MGWNLLWILLVVSAVCCAIGFKKYVWFLSIGYGFSVIGIGICLFVMMLIGTLPLSIGAIIYCALFCVYGGRLSGFLLVREIKNAAYKKTLDEATKTEKPMPIFVSFAIWVYVSFQYVCQTSPLFYKLFNGTPDGILLYVGIAISIIGIILEAVADKQKSAQKKERPDMVATKGLYKMCRCPNYFGEITFWTGLFVSSLNVLNTVGQWILAVFGYISIVYVMFNGAQRLEGRQMKRYGDNEEYKAYVEKTPIIIPLLPIYHLYKEKKAK